MNYVIFEAGEVDEFDHVKGIGGGEVGKRGFGVGETRWELVAVVL